MQETAGITYVSLGKGATPLICLHGIGGNTESFRPQLDFFSRHRRTIAWNMPGYGGSPLLEDTSFTNYAAALTAFMDALNIGKAHIMGQSIGGMIAQELAATRPDRVASLILIATTPSFGGRDETFKDQFLRARLAPLDAGKTIAELAPAIVAEITGPKTGPDATASAIASMAAVPEQSYRETIRCLTTFNRRGDLAHMQMPACLIAGEHDTNAPWRTMQKMAEKIPDAEFHLIGNAGHLVNLEAPQETNAIVEKFLARTEVVQ